MENYLNLSNIDRNEIVLKSKIFTPLQFEVLKKRLQKQELNSNEKTYYYKFIKPKILAMLSFSGFSEFIIMGRENIIKKREKKAISIIKKLKKKHKNKKIMVSGSFLFSEKYNDIDAFVFGKYEKEDYNNEKVHVNFINESAFNSIFFSSLSQISITNFTYDAKQEFIFETEDVLQAYEALVNETINKEENKKTLRNFLLYTEYMSSGVILSPKELHLLAKKLLNRTDILRILSDKLLNAVILTYDAEILCKTLSQKIDDYKLLAEDYKEAKNLEIYIDTYTKVIDFASSGSENSEAETKKQGF